MIKSINPSTEELIKEYDVYSNDRVIHIVNKVSDEYEIWKNISYKNRSNILINIANDLDNNLECHAKMISLEVGKPIVESRLEIEKCIWVLRYFAKNAELFLKKKNIQTEYKESYIQYDPIGIVFGIMPWNFPYWQVIRFIAPLLMVGNTCIVKHASNVSGCSLLIEKLIMDNSPYKNIYRSLLIKSNQVEFIIKHSDIKGVSLTGSDKAGSEVAMQAGKEIKKTVLELGGSDPFIVLEDANVSRAAKTGVSARFLNTDKVVLLLNVFWYKIIYMMNLLILSVVKLITW